MFIPLNVTTLGTNVFERCLLSNIYCDIGYKPSGWDEDWNLFSGVPSANVVWGA